MTEVTDAAQRRQAIDPLGSYCVSAPAGSGKTELLIQRYLALLARVQRPEQILAITFTRKAAAEMRERVLDALAAARDNAPCDSPHKQLTRDLALEALAADGREGWRLLENTGRMNIKTIDSFCASLTRQMPILSEFGAQASPQDDAQAYYQEAVEELYGLLDTGHPITADLRAMLRHFDNKWQNVQTLLVEMLMRRDQWIRNIHEPGSGPEAETYIVSAVEEVIRDELLALSEVLAPFRPELLDLMQYAAQNLGLPVPEDFPAGIPGALPDWWRISNMLLTKDGKKFRQSVRVNEGFPPGKDERSADYKGRMSDLLKQLAALPGLYERLLGVRVLPQMALGSEGWELVIHLSRLLPVLSAQLLLVFRRHQVVDHAQVSTSALQALGDEDAPTDLALRLDYRIEHILVDEFQDTADNQNELLKKLTRGWPEHNAANPAAPRTLMIVGDAMQSIYGFRSANVGLFMKARKQGINGVPLQPLQLHCNFRSNANIIDWVNATFSRAFPLDEDIAAGQVVYSPAIAAKPALTGAEITVDGFEGEGRWPAEVEFICQRIARCVADGERDIAVLGRQRSHLHPITRRLKELGVGYQADSLDSLAESPLVTDLLNLCAALASDADRLAWLALLRAPWCGLALADLHALARYGDGFPHQSIRATIADEELAGSLSVDGAQRLAHVRQAVARAHASRDRLDLRNWVERFWLELGGPRCAPDALALDDAESFFRLLEVAQAEGVGLDVRWLRRQVDRRFMSGGDPASPVRVMTLHKAKGLEFSRVFIPRLDGHSRVDGRDILVWDDHTTGSGARAFLLAADDRQKEGPPTLYSYLRELRKRKSRNEQTRLLYVGATRAIDHLHLSGGVNLEEEDDAPRKASDTTLMARIWETFSEQVRVHHVGDAVTLSSAPAPPLLRLRLEDLPAATLETAPQVGDAPPERADNHYERSLGTVIHLALEELSLLPALPDTAGEEDSARWRQALRIEGLSGGSLASAHDAVLESVSATLARGGEGRWVLSNEHTDRRSEWPVTVVLDDGVVAERVIDRSFIDPQSGERWIVDYKSSRPIEGESWDAFTQRESEHYRDQLRGYRDALSQLGEAPIRCALFFTAFGRLHEVSELDDSGESTA